MNDLILAVHIKNLREEELEQATKAMVKELARLQGKVCYESTEPELDIITKGEG